MELKEVTRSWTRWRAVRKEYGALAPRYDSDWAWYAKKTHHEVLRQLELKEGEKVLDLGCGTGSLLFHLMQERKAELFGVDLSQLMLGEAKKKLKGSVPLLQTEAMQLPFKEDTFDWVLSCSAFHYFPDVDCALQEVRRVLKKGGSFACTDWCSDFKAMRIVQHYQNMRRKAPVKIFSSKRWRRLLEEAGFQKVEIEVYKVNWLWGMVTVCGRGKGRVQHEEGKNPEVTRRKV